MKEPTPASDISMTRRPVGEASSRSHSGVFPLIPLTVAVTLVIAPVSPETEIGEGYPGSSTGPVVDPLPVQPIPFGFENVAAPAGAARSSNANTALQITRRICGQG